jgi:hypothetical protein
MLPVLGPFLDLVEVARSAWSRSLGASWDHSSAHCVVAGQKKGPDDTEEHRDQVRLLQTQERHGTPLVKFCAFDNPGAIPCPLGQLQWDSRKMFDKNRPGQLRG